jgi:hypothetical protein
LNQDVIARPVSTHPLSLREVVGRILRSHPSYDWLDQCRAAIPEASEELLLRVIDDLYESEIRAWGHHDLSQR